MIAEIGNVGRKAAEHKAAIAVDPRDRGEIELGQVETRVGPAGLGRRHRGALARGVEAEAVIGAGEARGIAGARGDQRRAGGRRR